MSFMHQGLSRNTALIAGIALCVACLYIVLTYRFASLELEVQLQKKEDASLAVSLWRYGTIQSVNRDNGTFVVSTESRFRPGAGYISLLIHVRPDTFIAEQQLIRSGDVYTDLSAPEKRSIDNLTPGAQVALLLDNARNREGIEARVVLFGSPL